MRVLVAEDDQDVRELLLVSFARAGIEAKTAMDGRSAYLALKREKFDVLVTDWVMPELSGIELTRLVRSDPEIAHLPIVMVTGSRKAGVNRAAAHEVGVTDMLTKPYSSRDLIRRVRLAAGEII